MSRPAAPLDGRIALVTGAATGIGIGIASSPAADGARLVVNYLNTLEPAAAVAGIEKGGGTAYAPAADVTVHGDHPSTDDRLVGECGHLDILANDAGWVTTRNIRVSGGNA